MRYLLVVIALVAILPFQLQAQQTWHVYPGQSIQAAIDNADPGDNVVVHSEIFRGYTYCESITLAAGISVYSVDYEAPVTIDGQGADQTVYFSGNGQGMYFGGPDVGFTIKGGSMYGVNFVGCENIHVEDLVVQSDPWHSAMSINTQDETTAHFKNIKIENQSEAFFGLYLGASDVTVENLWVQNVANIGVCAEWYEPTLHGVRIQNCDIGVKAWNSFVDIIGTEYPWNYIRDCRVGASTSPYDWSARITAENVIFQTCETGIYGGGNEIQSGSVIATGCEFNDCDFGISSNWGYGTIKECEFRDITNTGISITNFHFTPFIIGGDDPENQEQNEFSSITGTGIYLGSGARADIGFNEFDHVDGTAILVETGNAEVSIDGCTMLGSGCFQGIRTRGANTMATVRSCIIQDYDSAVLPPPRGVAVTDLFMTGPTANLGTESPDDPGNNHFTDNTADLFYGPIITQPGQTPVPIYAQHNFWGEDPPAPQSFGGSWAYYIIYDPWLHQPPPLAPPLVDEPSIPDRLVLEPVRPNPVRETASLVFGLPSYGEAQLSVWDTQGRLVTTLLTGKHSAGTDIVEWDTADGSGSPAPAGVYFCRLSSSEGEITRRLVLVR